MLNPQTRALLDFIEQHGGPPLHTLSPVAARVVASQRRKPLQPPAPEVASVIALQVPRSPDPIPLRLYRPLGSHDSEVLPVLLYYHGGGFVLGDLDSHDVVCRQLANLAGCAVVAVDYRLAPEHPFPAAVIDAAAALGWLRENAADLHVDGTRIALGGDSAGGTLAAVTAIAARQTDMPPIAFQLLIYPATDSHCSSKSHQENGQGYFLTREMIAYFSKHYLADQTRYDDWRASPLLHPDLSKLPPALVLTAGFDPLRDEGAAYAQRLSAAGNLASHVCFEGQIHGFLPMGGAIHEANTAVAMCAGELRRALL